MSYELIESEKINLLFLTLSQMWEKINSLSQLDNNNKMILYSNQDMMTLLNVNSKLLKKYRDSGKLGYHQEQDKYWYTKTDLDHFLGKNHFPAFV